jgi:hypothetical protein
MAEIITAVYQSHTSVANVVDDLVATGIPQEEIRTREHEGKHEVQIRPESRHVPLCRRPG